MTARRFARYALLWLAVGATPAGCTHVNVRLSAAGTPTEARARNATRAAIGADPAAAADHDGVFVGVALSGGGSRSANFAAACLFELQRVGLLRRVDYISAVSGGTLAGAYYCAATDADWNPGNVEQKLAQDFATDLLVQTLLPWNVLAATFSDLDRSDLLAGTFRRKLFTRGGRELRFADLRPDRPRLLINSTDLQTGKGFTFCNEAFDELNTDLSRFPLAYAVTASSAVPVLLHHVTLRDYSTSYRQYRHLVDGGVVDNLGVETLARAYAAHVDAARAAGRPDPYPGGVVLLVIDARTTYDASVSAEADMGLVESLVAAAGLSSTVLVNRASSATLAELVVGNADDDTPAGQLRAEIDRIQRTGMVELEDRFGHRVRIAHIGLSRLDDISDLPFASFGQSLNNIATYFNISQTEAYHLHVAARLIVRRKFEPWLTEVARQLATGRPGLPAPEPAR